MSKRIGRFVLLSYLISWCIWGSLGLLTHYADMKFGQVYCLTLFILGGLGPTFAAFLTVNPKIDKNEFKAYISKVFKIRLHPYWYFFLFSIPFILFSIPYFLNYMSASLKQPFFTRPIYWFLIYMVSNILFGGLEELGWRGILLPEFMKKFSALVSTLLTSIIWSLWHLPLWLVKGSPQEGSSFLIFVIMGLCFSFILSVIYIGTRSIFLCVLAHSLFNTYPSIITIPSDNIYIAFLIMLLFSISLFLGFRAKRPASKYVSRNV